MKKKTLEELNALLKVYRKAREQVALALLDYKPNSTRDQQLIIELNKIIKELEEEAEKFTWTAFIREYKSEIKISEQKLKSLNIKQLWNSLTQIDKKAIEHLETETRWRLIIAARWIRREVLTVIDEVKQANIRELLQVSIATWQSTEWIVKTAVKDFRNEWIEAFVAIDGRKLKLENYARIIIRNNIQQAHNDAAYNRYVEAWIKVVKYSVIWDAKVSDICRPREWKFFFIDSIETLPSWSHFNCRHQLIPIVRVPEWVEVHTWYPN